MIPFDPIPADVLRQRLSDAFCNALAEYLPAPEPPEEVRKKLVRALLQYERFKTFSVDIPKHERRRELTKLGKAAQTLSKALADMPSSLRSETAVRFEHHQVDLRALDRGTQLIFELDEMSDLIATLATVADAQLRAVDQAPRPRPSEQHTALRHLITDLRESFFGKGEAAPCYYDDLSGTYQGAFARFVFDVVRFHEPDHTITDLALGKLIIRTRQKS